MKLPHRLFIDRDAPAQADLGPDPDAPPTRALQPGEVRLAIDRFALTANNVTYAAFGRAMRYWDFFQAPQSALGCLPVWGFATVAESRVEGEAAQLFVPGRRLYGFLPAGSHLVVRPQMAGRRAFDDAAAHRQGLPAVYNRYVWCDLDPAWRADGEGLQAVLRPLYMTAFLLDDFLASEDYFGAQQLVLSSASSKTALATAHALSLRRGATGHPSVIGLTSPAHRAAVTANGCFDTVLDYDALPSLDAAKRTVYVDFSGNATLRARIHGHFGEALVFSSAIGGTHWQSLGGSHGLPGPRPTLFFAPAQAARRQAPPPQGWGAAALATRIEEGWKGFVERASAAQPPWIEITAVHGPQALLAAYREVVAGQVDPRRGLMVAMA